MRILKPIITIAVLAFIVYALYFWIIIPLFFNNKVELVHMIDPDSYLAMKDGNIIEIQLIGANVPELSGADTSLRKYECYSKEAKEIVLDTYFRGDKSGNRYVTVEPDAELGKKDIHGRNLMYVTLGDGTFLNEVLVRDGLATVFEADYREKDRFLELEKQAKEQDLGLWKICK